ncbi:MAG: ATP-binding protein, partial [Nitrospirales bacterium]|nr:ATP-binding protein [Nitrospirales bacterium]
DPAATEALIEALTGVIMERLSKTGQAFQIFPILRLADIFGLMPEEVAALIMAIATEIDRRYERVFGFCNDDLTRKNPTVGLALELLYADRRERIAGQRIFAPVSSIVSHNLIKIHDTGKEGISLKSEFSVDERIRRYILGDTGISQPPVSSLSISYHPGMPGTNNQGRPEITKKMMEILKKNRHEEGRRSVFWLYGKAEEEKLQTAEVLCRDIGLPLLAADLEQLLYDQDHASALIYIFREALLQSGLLFLRKADCLYRDDERSVSLRTALMNVMARMSWVTFMSAETLWVPEGSVHKTQWYPFAVDLPGFSERRALWSGMLTGADLSASEIDALAGRFIFGAGRISEAVSHAKALSGERISAEDIYRACRARSGQRLSVYAKKVRPHYRLSDIVLPEDKMEQVREICNHIKHRHTVYFTWGFEKKLALGKGMNILFSGPSGTGKTMCADIIANEFNLGMYQIDLSSVVSKYIGETEKNLSAIFREAAAGDVVLFFDEADALFGKRSEVKDAHDRYANIEINYLLQKMEEHEGIVVLSTNLGKNLDEAFLRRLHFTIDFPFPEVGQRLLIWKRTFPEDAPLSDDIDYSFLAERFRLSGGNIRNVAVTAAFYAAEASSPITMRHIILAVKREMQKLGRLCVKGDFGSYYDLIEERCAS